MTRIRGHISIAAISIALLVIATAPGARASHAGGGAPAPAESGGDIAVDPGFKLSSRRATKLGSKIRVRGVAPGAAEALVTIEREYAKGAWLAVGTATTDGAGEFSTVWLPEKPGRHVLRAVLESANAAQGGHDAPDRVSVSRAVVVHRVSRASWYGPGFFGRQTACGQRLGRRTLGVAHRRLACGTRVSLLYRGRRVVVPVIDRGPFVRGITWDLTQATARRLGITHTTRVGAAVVTP